MHNKWARRLPNPPLKRALFYYLRCFNSVLTENSPLLIHLGIAANAMYEDTETAAFLQ